MLTRLKVNGFKNLVDVDVRFGPFTCIAGANGVGKSNLFDAIRFLSAMADKPIIEAALSVRDEGGRTADVRSLFHRVGKSYDDRMCFEAEMIVPREGIDDLGQKAEATNTFLRYSVELAYRSEPSRINGALELVKEELTHIQKGEAHKHLLFPHNAKQWRDSAIVAKRRAPYFISTHGDGAARVVKRHQDGSSGRPLERSAINLPRTVLSAANAAESPTALLARCEMQSWRLLQLEPSALRKPDPFSAPTGLGSDGAHLPATLNHLALRLSTEPIADGRVYAKVANRLAELIRDIREVMVDRDEKRELLTLQIVDADGTTHPARALSDGTLRFLALAVLELDPSAQGLLCLEEPENGIHPERIPAMLRLLQDIATDVDEPVDDANPLRQVIVNTHSPAVVGQVPDDSLLVAELREHVRDRQIFKRVCFPCLADTWRQKKAPDSTIVDVVSKGKLLAYLNPNALLDSCMDGQVGRKSRVRRVADRADLRQFLLFPGTQKAS